jgi:hypothetical protein
LLAFRLIGCFVTSVPQSSVTCSSHPHASANCRPVLLHPFQDPVHVRSSVICHYDSVSEPTLINQRNSFNAQGKVSPLVMGRCRSSCSKGQGGMLTFVFNPITPSPITYVQLLFVARRPGWVSDQAKYIKNPNMVDSLRRVHLLCI